MTNRAIRLWGGVAAIVAGALAMTTARVGADTYPRQAGIKIAGYTFDYTLTDASSEFMVKEGVDVRFVAAGVSSIELDLCKFSAQPRSPQAQINRAIPARNRAVRPRRPGHARRPAAKGMTVTAVACGGQSADLAAR